MLNNLAIALVSLGLFISLPISAQDLQYVGNSTGVTKGGVGVVVLSNLCDADFPGARICTSEEVLLNIAPPADDLDDNPQWVLPTFVSGAYKIFDASGTEGQPTSLSCLGWRSSSSSYTGLTVSDDGKFERKGCHVTRQVACCSPAP